MADSSELVESRGDNCKGNVSRRQLFCPHCDWLVPKSTYYRHREQFYDPIQDVWSAVKVNRTTTMPAADANGECEYDQMDFAGFGEADDSFPIDDEGKVNTEPSTAEAIASTKG